MNTNQAKQIPIEAIMERTGRRPHTIKRGGDEWWYLSPFRPEKTPSFKVNRPKNVWFDFGEGKGGTSIDLVMTLQNTTVQGALAILAAEHTPIKSASMRSPKPKPPIEALTLTHIKPLKNQALIDYLVSRGIAIAPVSHFVNEAYYHTDQGKQYFALAFQNCSGGWELRNPYFKGCIGTKDLSVIPGTRPVVLVFEGFIDFLSCLTLYGSAVVDHTILVLNSVTMAQAAAEHIQTGHYRKAFFFLDNDDAGRSALDHISKNISVPFVNESHRYANFKDLNEYICSEK